MRFRTVHLPPWIRPLLGLGTLCAIAIWLRHDLARLHFPGIAAIPCMVFLGLLWIANQLVLAEALRQALGQSDRSRHPHGWPRRAILDGSVLRGYFNLLLPLSGTALLGAHLRTQIAVPFSRYWYGTLRLLIYQSAVLGILMFILLGTADLNPKLRIAMSTAAVLALGPLGLPVAGRLRRLPGWLRKGLAHLGLGPDTNMDPVGWPQATHGVFLQALAFGLRLARLYVALRIMGTPVSPFPLLMMQIASDLATLLNLTPNSIGIREAAIVFAGHAGGLATGALLAAALLDRVVTTALLLLWGQWLIWKRPGIDRPA